MKIKLLHPDYMPVRATDGAAGFDIKAYVQEPVTVFQGETKLVPLGFHLEIEPGFAAYLLPRSGLGHKNGIVLGNLVGLIDHDYRGQVFASIWNRSDKYGGAFTIHPGERIAQMVIAPVWAGSLEVIADLTDTERGEGGFGSTGQA